MLSTLQLNEKNALYFVHDSRVIRAKAALIEWLS